MTIPLDAIDPEVHTLRWRRSFEHHLDLVPPVMDAVVSATIPHIPAGRFDQDKVTGGGVVDNMTAFLRGVDVDDTGRITDVGAAADAQHLWWWVVSFTRAVLSNVKVVRSVPDLPEKPNADPLTARADALLIIGWLIDHADQIEQLTVYQDDIDEMFQEIRHLRGKYGVHERPRRPRARCAICGTVSVVVTWVDGPHGSPKPVKAGKCRECGQEYREPVEPVNEVHTGGREVLSPECADLMHEMCKSMHCECHCHELRAAA
jgi:hypothetical protein